MMGAFDNRQNTRPIRSGYPQAAMKKGKEYSGKRKAGTIAL